MKNIIAFLLGIFSVCAVKISTKPPANAYQYNGNFFWKVGKSDTYDKGDLHRTLFNDYPVCIYRDRNNSLIATSDVCIHRGASLSSGKLLENNCIQCPYHGWEYNNGIVKTVPGCPDMKGKIGTPRFDVKEINDDVYLSPTYDLNSKNGIIAKNDIYVPPESKDNNFVRISGRKHIKRPNFLVTENVLDMMHISYVHTFGNQVSPIPYEIKYEDIDDFSGKTTFYYTAGPNSMSSIIGNAKEVKVENEFYLPDTTVTRVFAGNIVKTIITHCYPIGRNESILHYDLYRNFLTFPVFDPLFYKQMDITLKEDVGILNSIYDNYIKGFMTTKYDITQLKYRAKWNKEFIKEKNEKKEDN